MWKIILIVFWLGILAGIDLRYKKIPIWLLAVSGMIMTSVSLTEIFMVGMQGMQLFWGMLPGVGMVMIALISKKAGWADGIVLALLGVMVGFRACAFSFILSMLMISLVSLVLLISKRVSQNTKLPYLPFLWIGYLAQAAMKIGV